MLHHCFLCWRSSWVNGNLLRNPAMRISSLSDQLAPIFKSGAEVSLFSLLLSCCIEKVESWALAGICWLSECLALIATVNLSVRYSAWTIGAGNAVGKGLVRWTVFFARLFSSWVPGSGSGLATEEPEHSLCAASLSTRAALLC